MNKQQINRIGRLAEAVVRDSMASGLTWDEAIAALGVASHAMAAKAAREGDGTEADCAAHAQRQFQQGFEQSAEILRTYLT